MAKKTATDVLIESVAQDVTEIKQDVRELKTDMADAREIGSKVEVRQEQHNELLAEHMRRTEIAEEMLTILKTEHAQTKEIMAAIMKQLEPLKTHMNMWAGAGKFVAVLGTVLTVAYTIYKIYSIYHM